MGVSDDRIVPGQGGTGTALQVAMSSSCLLCHAGDTDLDRMVESSPRCRASSYPSSHKNGGESGTEKVWYTGPFRAWECVGFLGAFLVAWLSNGRGWWCVCRRMFYLQFMEKSCLLNVRERLSLILQTPSVLVMGTVYCYLLEIWKKNLKMGVENMQGFLTECLL